MQNLSFLLLITTLSITILESNGHWVQRWEKRWFHKTLTYLTNRGLCGRRCVFKGISRYNVFIHSENLYLFSSKGYYTLGMSTWDMEPEGPSCEEGLHVGIKDSGKCTSC